MWPLVLLSRPLPGSKSEPVGGSRAATRTVEDLHFGGLQRESRQTPYSSLGDCPSWPKEGGVFPFLQISGLSEGACHLPRQPFFLFSMGLLGLSTARYCGALRRGLPLPSAKAAWWHGTILFCLSSGLSCLMASSWPPQAPSSSRTLGSPKSTWHSLSPPLFWHCPPG